MLSRSLAAALLAISLLVPPALGQSFPARPVKVLIPYAAGGLPDVVGRLIGQKFQEATGQSLVLDNRGGAGGIIAADAAAKATPDGYTLVMASAAQISIARALHHQLPFDPEADLVPVTHLIDTPMILFAATGFQGGVPELISRAKAKPADIPMASTGNGTISHLAQELFAQHAGIKLLHVPYRGAAQAMNDMIAGAVPLIFTTVGSAKPIMDAGQIRPLAVASSRRTGALADLPTFAELGIPGVEAPVWFGMMAPKGTPEAVIARLDQEFRKALAAPEVKERLGQIGADISGDGPAGFRTLIQADMKRWAGVVKTANIKLE
jgi:tripartite-type tricarboxylate transporter receptor subunit TctC